MESHKSDDVIRIGTNEKETLETKPMANRSNALPPRCGMVTVSILAKWSVRARKARSWFVRAGKAQSLEDIPSMPAEIEVAEEDDPSVTTLPCLEEPESASSERLVPDEKVQSLEDFIRRLIEKGNDEDVTRYRLLYISLLHNDWKEAADFIEKNPKALTEVISELSETVFHNIVESDQDCAIQLLRKCLQKILSKSLESVLERKNSSGCTALFNAAIVGNIEAAKLLVESNRNLLTMKNNDQLLPLHHAGISGHKETVKYLLSEMKKSDQDSNLLAGQSGFQLVKILIQANLYDIASKLLEEFSNLSREELYSRGIILETLATKPMAFESGSRLQYWQQLIYNCIPVQEEHIHDCAQQNQKSDLEYQNHKSQNSSTKPSPFRFFGSWSQKLHVVLWNIIMHLAPSVRGIHDKKLMHKHTVKIVGMMCAGVPWRFNDALQSLKMPILSAARLGIPEIVKEILRAYPDSLIFEDERGNNALMLAILHRQEEVFKLVSQFGVMKQLKGNNMRNQFRENVLQLAAKSAPAREIPGAALQLQRELQWFKAVENYVQSPLHEDRNGWGTPREEFTERHKDLIEKGEKWMKDNAKSCTIVVSLIITVVFAAAFTVPGGNDDNGIPNFLHQLSFIIFVTSDMLALCSSTTSLLMFLGILTSSYSDEDFLVSLPRKLIIGLITMFFSIACMMVAFGATIYMIVSHPWKWVIIPIVLLSCIPVTLFVKLQFPLLVQIYSSTYAPTISQPLKKM